jgi:8-oxo-dGTP diphosphatase
VVIEQEGQVLLVKRGTGPGMGLWSIPAGFVEFDEDPALAAVRECLEETGLRVELAGLIDVLPGSGMSGEASFLIVYRGRIVEGEMLANDDADQVAFFDVGNLPQLAFDSTERALEIWRQRARV